MTDSGIEWTTHTFNPWWGCSKVSPGCLNCYAEALANRFSGDIWGRGKPRRTFGDKHWAQPLKWNADARCSGRRAKVFCASMADVFDPEAPAAERQKLWRLIEQTPWLDWQLLTKRPELIADCLPEAWLQQARPNVWRERRRSQT
jgi:protein gp37